MTALRYRDEASGKIPWRVNFLKWQTVNGVKLPARIAVTWDDQGEPWSYYSVATLPLTACADRRPLCSVATG